MSRIASVFEQQRHKALIAYVTVGYPSVEATLKVVPLLASSGCDMVELGIPFSDPLADGVTIQNASFHALKEGVTPGLCLEVARELRQNTTIPLAFMTYFNPVFSYGLEKFFSDCASSGINGLIIPDLPPDEGSNLETASQNNSIDLIYLLSPASDENRVRFVAQRSRGFIYLVSVTGITGARDNLPPDLGEFISRVRKVTSQPLCVGFGISTAEQAKSVTRLADGVIVGSRIVQLMASNDNFDALCSFVKELRTAIDQLCN
jgi:tryptophan synthase alpha chain